jgi:hypothetical protein
MYAADVEINVHKITCRVVSSAYIPLGGVTGVLAVLCGSIGSNLHTVGHHPMHLPQVGCAD